MNKLGIFSCMLLLLLASKSSAFALECCNGNIGFSLDLLYLKPCSDGFYPALKIVRTSGTEPSGLLAENIRQKVLNLPFDYEAGFRLGLHRCSCGRFPEASLAWSRYTPTVTFHLEEIQPVLQPDNF